MEQPGPLLAIEAGGTKFVCALQRADGELCERVRIATRAPEQTLAEVLQWLHAASARVGAPRALGMGSFGPLALDPARPDYGQLLRTPKAGWGGTDLLAPFRALGIPLSIDTDVNAAALAEARLGAGRGLNAVLYLTVGTGIGGGAVLAGQTVRGLLHPEMGHLRPRRHPDDQGFSGLCPYHGDCFEGLAAGPALVARLGRELGATAPDHPIWAIEADYLAQLCAALSYVLSPQRIVMGGGVMQAALYPAIIERLRHWFCGYPGVPELDTGLERYVCAPALGADSGLLGAALLAQEALERCARGESAAR